MNTANKLRTIAEQHNTIKKILEESKDRAEEGGLYFYYYGYLSPPIIQHLEEVHGFIVKDNISNKPWSFGIGYNYTISWE